MRVKRSETMTSVVELGGTSNVLRYTPGGGKWETLWGNLLLIQNMFILRHLCRRLENTARGTSSTIIVKVKEKKIWQTTIIIWFIISSSISYSNEKTVHVLKICMSKIRNVILG